MKKILFNGNYNTSLNHLFKTTLVLCLMCLIHHKTKANCNNANWQALKALYTNTDGDSWTNNTGWDLVADNTTAPATCDFSGMYGVTAITANNQNPPSMYVTALQLQSNNLIGNLPAEIANLGAMNTINLSNNQISGSLPANWFDLNNTGELRYVDLSNNQISGNLPVDQNMIEIVSMNLSNNQITGSIPNEYFIHINELYLNNNQLSGNMNGLVNIAFNKKIDISNNQLSGCYIQILKSKCNQQDIDKAVISDGNDFDAAWDDFCANDAGACAASCHIDDWTALQALYATTDGDNWNNNLNWQIVDPGLTTPPLNCDLGSMFGVEIVNNGRLATLNLFNNNLNGTIPPEIGLLSEANTITLSNNLLTGNLPEELGLLNLSELHVTNNQLSGCFYPALSSLCNLYSAGIDYGNDFDGTWSSFCSAGASPVCTELNIDIFLEGAYDKNAPDQSFSPRHTNQLYLKNVLPGMVAPGATTSVTQAGQPYNRPPWNYWGNEGANFTNSDYSSTDVDWVLVSIRSDIHKSNEVAQLAGILQVNGSIRFFSKVYLNSAIEYYVVVEHRNHLPVMGQFTTSVSNSILSFDFRFEDSYTGGGTGAGQKYLGPWNAAYAGNSIQGNGGMGETNDINGNDKIPWSTNNGKFYVYSPEDFNLDGDTNGYDKIYWAENNGISSRIPQ